MKALIAAAAVSLVLMGVAEAKPLSDSEITQRIIQESISSYPGNCPCPYNTAKNGSSCGKRSAYSKKGGYSPVCYAKDVSQSMIKEYRDAKAAH